MTSQQKWLATLRWLRRNFPVELPVRVRTCNMEDYGDSSCYHNRKKGFIVRIRKAQSLGSKLDTVLHEWAHIMAWRGAERHEAHSSEWGIAYAKIYRTFLEWDFGRAQKKRTDGPLPGQLEFDF